MPRWSPHSRMEYAGKSLTQNAILSVKMARKRYLPPLFFNTKFHIPDIFKSIADCQLHPKKTTCQKQTLQDASHPNGYKCSTYGLYLLWLCLLKSPHIITQILFYFVSQEPTSQCCGKGLGLHKDGIHTWQLSP